MDSKDYTVLDDLIEKPSKSKIRKYFDCFHWTTRKIHSDSYTGNKEEQTAGMVTIPASLKRKYRESFMHY